MAVRPAFGIALCPGLAGIELGLDLASDGATRTAVYVEREAFVVAGLVARMEAGLICPAPIWSDLITFDGKPWRGKVDWLAAGFPCQPWSGAGQQRGTDDDRWLWPDIARIIREADPQWCFFENVPGLASSGKMDDDTTDALRNGLALVLGDLADLGFDAEWTVLGAYDIGAPHRRKRVWILAHRNGRGLHIFGKRGLPSDGEPQRRSDADGCDPDVGDGHGFGHHRGGHGQDFIGRREPANAGGELGDCLCLRPQGFGEGGSAQGPTDGADSSATARISDPDRLGLRNESGWRAGACGPEAGEPGATRSLWPPRPKDERGWRDYIAAHGPQPAVRADADGLSRRVDELRAIGNGAVPLAAAYAVRALAARAMRL